MNNYNGREEKKGGFWSALSGLFRGGSSAVGGASSGGLGSAGGLGGLFATKAGLVGMVLGGATIAAGVGVVYNFIGPSSKPVYSPELFQNSYYEEEASKAGFERAQARNSSSAESSTLDMFREQAKKDGLGGLASEASDQEKADAASGSPAGGASADSEAPGAPGGSEMAAGSNSGAPKLQAGSGFGGKGGSGSGTSMPKMQGNGGMSGGIGGQFQSVYKAPIQANGGKTSGMSASAARVNSSPRYAVPLGKGKGAYGQAKYAKNMSAKAASYSGAQSAGMATQALSGETSGSGDVGAAGTGAGLGGAGVSNGSALKANDPSLSGNESTPPAVPEPTDVDPWQKYEDMAMYSLLAGGILVALTGILAKQANTSLALGPAGLAAYAAWKMAAMIAGYAAIAAGLVAIFAGLMMFSKYGQKMMGAVYMAAGAMIIWKAYQAMQGINEPKTTSATEGGKVDMNKPAAGDKMTIGDKNYVESGGKWVAEPAKLVIPAPATPPVTTPPPTPQPPAKVWPPVTQTT